MNKIKILSICIIALLFHSCSSDEPAADSAKYGFDGSIFGESATWATPEFKYAAQLHSDPFDASNQEKAHSFVLFNYGDGKHIALGLVNYVSPDEFDNIFVNGTFALEDIFYLDLIKDQLEYRAVSGTLTITGVEKISEHAIRVQADVTADMKPRFEPDAQISQEISGHLEMEFTRQ